MVCLVDWVPRAFATWLSIKTEFKRKTARPWEFAVQGPGLPD